MGEITFTLTDLLWLAGAICTIAAAWKIIKNNPVARHEKLLDEHEKLIKDQGDTERMLCKCMLALIDHEITGNGIENMKEIRSEMQSYLIEKQL